MRAELEQGHAQELSQAVSKAWERAAREREAALEKARAEGAADARRDAEERFAAERMATARRAAAGALREGRRADGREAARPRATINGLREELRAARARRREAEAVAAREQRRAVVEAVAAVEEMARSKGAKRGGAAAEEAAAIAAAAEQWRGALALARRRKASVAPAVPRASDQWRQIRGGGIGVGSGRLKFAAAPSAARAALAPLNLANIAWIRANFGGFQLRVPHVEEQHRALGRRVVEHLVLEGVVEDQRPSSSHGRVSSATRIAHRAAPSVPSAGGTTSGRWTRTRKLHGDVCAAMRAPGCSVEKKANANGMPSISPGTPARAAAVCGQRSHIGSRRSPRATLDHCPVPVAAAVEPACVVALVDVVVARQILRAHRQVLAADCGRRRLDAGSQLHLAPRSRRATASR